MAMKSQNSLIKFIKSSGIFLIGSVLSKTIVFFMLPIYTAYIPPADNGYFDVSITYITLLAGFLFFDVWTSVMRYMYDRAVLKEKYKVVSSGWVIFGFSSLVYGVVGAVIICFFNIRYAGFIFLYGLVMNLSNMYGFIARGFEKNNAFALSGIVNTVVSVVTNVLLIVVFRWNFVSLYLAFIFGNLAQVLYLELATHALSSLIRVKFDNRLTKEMLWYSLPLCLNSVAYWLLNSFNRVVINHTLGYRANGIFAIGSKFGMIISVVTTCFTFAWQDLSFSRTAESGKDAAFFSNACNAYMKFLGAGAAVLIPACYIIFPVMVDPSYNDSRNTIPLFLLVGLISALSTFIGNIFYAIKATRAIFISMVASCLLNLALCYPLVTNFGLNGANLSIFLSFLFNIIIRHIILRKEISFRLDLKAVFLLAIWIGASMLFYQFGNLMLNIFWFVLCVGITLYLFRDMIQSVWKSIIKRG